MSRSTVLQRGLDRYLGNFIALVLGARRPIAARIENPDRIGLIQPTAIGDLIVASGLIAHVRTTFPRAEVHLLHGLSNRAALDVLEPGIIGHVVDFTRPVAALKHIRSLDLDILVDLVPWSTLTALICRFSGVALTLGFSVPGTFRHFLFAKVADHSCDVHQSQNFEALAGCFGRMDHYTYRLRKSFPRPGIWLPYDRLIVCHIRPGGSQASAKAWPTDRWVDLVSRLCDAGYAIAFSGSAADQSEVESVMAQVERPGRQCFSLAGGVSLPEFCFVLQHALLAISVDTSPLHLASALGLPIVGIHGPSLSRRWGAISPNSRSIDASHPAAGYIQFGFESHPKAGEIMRSISVDEVYGAASTLLSSRKGWARTLVGATADPLQE
jgi:ADP-heptose:LPS heptosyltransferase